MTQNCTEDSDPVTQEVASTATVAAGDTWQALAHDLASLVHRKGLGQKMLADACGKSVASISTWLNANRKIRRDALRTIVELCGDDPDVWAARWEELAPSARGRKPVHQPPNLALLIAQALDPENRLVSGAEIEVTIRVKMP